MQTRFATTELALLLAHLGADVEPVAAAAERVLAEPLPDLLAGGRQFTFLGTGWTCGLASEAALKLREAAGAWTEAYPAMEFRHGPDRGDRPGQRGVDTRTGARRPGRRDRRGRRQAVAWARASAGRTGQGAPARRAAIARAAGLDPDRPRNLARSVILAAATGGR